MKKSAIFSDLVFCFFVVALTILCLLRYLRFPLALACFFSIIVGLLFTIPLFILLDKKFGRVLLKKEEEKELNNLILYLTLSSEKELSIIFYNLYQKIITKESEQINDTNNTKDYTITIKNFYKSYTISTKKNLIFYRFTFSEDNGDFIKKVLQVCTKKEKIILCPKLNEKEKKLLNIFSVKIFTEDKIYLLFKENALMPVDLKKYNSQKQRKIKMNKKLWFSKKNSRPFFSGAVLLLISSLFTPFPYYYLIIGFILLFCSVLVRIFGFR